MNREFLPPPTSQPSPPGALPRAKPTIHLTPRESEIVRYVMLGESNKQIARRTGVSVGTVEAHLSKAYGKLGVRSRSQLATHLPAIRSASAGVDEG